MPDYSGYPVFNLLRQSVRLDDEKEAVLEARKTLENNPIDWEDLCRRAELHLVRPQLAKLMNKMPENIVKQDFIEKIDDAYRQNLYNQLNYVEHFFRIRDFLKLENIEIIPFKGFWLAHDAFSDLADRESFDVDVFTHTASLNKIRVIMEANGFTVEKLYSTFTLDEIIKRFQEYVFERIEDNRKIFRIEFHWGICPPEYEMGIRLEDLESQIIPGNIQGKDLDVFTPSANLLLVMLHHGGKDRFMMLRHILDIANILRSHADIDWEWLIMEARRFHAEKLVYVGVNLAARLTGIFIPDQIRTRCETDHINRMADNRIRLMMKPADKWFNTGFNINNWFFRMRSMDSTASRLRITVATAKTVVLNHLKN